MIFTPKKENRHARVSISGSFGVRLRESIRISTDSNFRWPYRARVQVLPDARLPAPIPRSPVNSDIDMAYREVNMSDSKVTTQPGRSYVLGHSDRELARLQVQARLIGPITRGFMRDSGIAPGMRVLDVGS